MYARAQVDWNIPRSNPALASARAMLACGKALWDLSALFASCLSAWLPLDVRLICDDSRHEVGINTGANIQESVDELFHMIEQATSNPATFFDFVCPIASQAS
jgi:hypothetical protein